MRSLSVLERYFVENLKNHRDTETFQVLNVPFLFFKSFIIFKIGFNNDLRAEFIAQLAAVKAKRINILILPAFSRIDVEKCLAALIGFFHDAFGFIWRDSVFVHAAFYPCILRRVDIHAETASLLKNVASAASYQHETVFIVGKFAYNAAFHNENFIR